MPFVPDLLACVLACLCSPGANFSNGPCASFSAWQAAGQDRGSKVLEMLPVAEIVAMGKAIVQ